MAWAALIPAAISAVSAGAKYFGNKKKKKAEQKQKAQVEGDVNDYQGAVNQYQQWLGQMMGLGSGPNYNAGAGYGASAANPEGGAAASSPYLGMGGGSSAGGMGGMLAGMFSPQTSTSTSSMNQFSKPEISAADVPLANMTRSQLMGDLSKTDFIDPSERYQRLQGLNAVTDKQEQAQANIAAKHGLNKDVLALGGPAMTTRAQGLTQMASELSDKNYQRKQAARGAAADWVKNFTGQRTSGTQTQTQTGPANYGAIMQALGMLAPQAKTTVL